MEGTFLILVGDSGIIFSKPQVSLITILKIQLGIQLISVVKQQSYHLINIRMNKKLVFKFIIDFI